MFATSPDAGAVRLAFHALFTRQWRWDRMSNTPRWSPLKAAIAVFFGVLVVGAVIAFSIQSATGRLQDNSFGAGEQVGHALGPVCCAAAVAAYFIQKQRR